MATTTGSDNDAARMPAPGSPPAGAWPALTAQRVIIADDHALARAGVRMMLDREGITVAAEADSPAALLDALRSTQADLLITDYAMPAGPSSDGLEMLMRIRLYYPQLPVLVLTMMSNLEVIAAILRCGVAGLVDKAAPLREIMDGLRSVALGRPYLSATIEERLHRHRSSSAARVRQRPSPREIEVLRLLNCGVPVAAIAAASARSVNTVRRQKASGMAKLGLRSDLDLYCYFRQHARTA